LKAPSATLVGTVLVTPAWGNCGFIVQRILARIAFIFLECPKLSFQEVMSLLGLGDGIVLTTDYRIMYVELVCKG
jgi:hypothetical protein